MKNDVELEQLQNEPVLNAKKNDKPLKQPHRSELKPKLNLMLSSQDNIKPSGMTKNDDAGQA